VSIIEGNGTELMYSGFLVDLLPSLLQTAGIERSYEFVPMREVSA
jgi:hypothetical protein